MKRHIRKMISGAAALAMVLSLAPMALAEGEVSYNFNDQTQTLSMGDGGVITSGSEQYTGAISYTQAASGKMDENDYAINATWSDVPYTVSGVGGFEIPCYAWVQNNEGDIRTMEFMFRYSEGCDYAVIQSSVAADPTGGPQNWLTVIDWVRFENGTVKVMTDNINGTYLDTGIAARPGQWYRIAIEAHFTANESIVYINGQGFPLTGLANAVRYFRWTQARLGMSALGGEGSRDVSVSIDDLEIYTGAYEPTGDEAVGYTVSGMNYNEGLKGFFVDDTATVADILGAVQTDCEMYMIDSLETNNIKSSGAVEEGNVVVIKSADGKTLDYLYVYTSNESLIVDEDSFSESSYYRMDGDTLYAGNGVKTGIFGRGSGDWSFELYTNELPSDVQGANRYNFMADNAGVYTADAFTREFSISAEGDFDEVIFITRANFSGTSELAYQEPVKFAKDGTITLNGDRVYPDARFKERQWYRVAITVYPRECKYDLYLNNEQVIDGCWLAMNDALWNSDAYDITGFQWFQIQPMYSAGEAGGETRSGSVYVDDTITYYGEYAESAENDVTFTSDYTVDEAAGTITVPENTDIDTFVSGMDFGTASPALYTDNTYTQQVDSWLEEGNVLVLTSVNGKVYSYYTIVIESDEPGPDPDPDDEFRVDDAIALSVTPAQSGGPATANASINMHVPADEAAREAVLVVAAYKDGVLQGIEYVSESVSGDRLLEAELELEETDGVTVKAMLWDGGMKPYVNSASQ